MLSLGLNATAQTNEMSNNIPVKSTVQKQLMDAIVIISTRSEKEGLDQIRKLIIENPREFKNSYHKLFLDPNLGKYTAVIKRYSRLVDILTFKELAKQTGIIDEYMQDSALTYVFFSSKREFMKELSVFVDNFEILIKKNKKNNTKTNRELLALFKANILLSESRDAIAYKIIKENRPYHAKALQALHYFVGIKDIPLFKDTANLVDALGVENFKLADPLFEHKPEYLFNYSAQKIEINYINKKEVENILVDVNEYLIKNKSINKPLKPYKLSIRDIKSEGNFVKLETVLVYEDGSYVDIEFTGDSVFVVCLEKSSKKWKVIYDLSRSDVPSEEEIKHIKKEFPVQFPVNILSEFWKSLLVKSS